MDVNRLSEVITVADNYDIILVDKSTNEGFRMDADTFMGLVKLAIPDASVSLKGLMTTEQVSRLSRLYSDYTSALTALGVE